MISEIQYGGRVTDEQDLRLLQCLTRSYFQEAMFAPDFKMVEHYPIPLLNTVGDYLGYIKHNLPKRESPEAFGLHANADITYSIQTTRYILDTILSIQPKDESAGDSGESEDLENKVSETREASVHRICSEMLEKLPSPCVPHRVQERLKALGELKPLNIFLRQELARMDKVLAIVLTTLTDLRLAIDGTVVMNESLRNALDCIYDSRVPASWIRVSL